ncbi:hypothetical protein GGG16DRAFT_115009 [Schizophyllum commune]
MRHSSANFGPRHPAANFGPQHPAAHGVLRMFLELNGEEVLGVGLLHCGTELLLEFKAYARMRRVEDVRVEPKTDTSSRRRTRRVENVHIELKTYTQALPYLDRWDYVSTMANELCYSTVVEKFLNIAMPARAKWTRTPLGEITRILSARVPASFGRDNPHPQPELCERERLMKFYERAPGARPPAPRRRRAPKGEMSVDLVSDGSNRPYRLASRTWWARTSSILRNRTLADAVAVVGTLDWCLGSEAIARRAGPFESQRHIIRTVTIDAVGTSPGKCNYVYLLEEREGASSAT